MKEQFAFLASNRFWMLIIGSASIVFIDPSFPTQHWSVNLGKFLALVSAGFIGIRTADRFGEKVGSEDTG